MEEISVSKSSVDDQKVFVEAPREGAANVSIAALFG